MEELETLFNSEKPSRSRSWLVGLLLAFFLHLILSQIDIPKMSSESPPPLQVNTVDPKKLEAIRQQWKKKGILLDQNPNRRNEKQASPHARYLSDRNIRVEKEQRARETAVLPHPPQSQSSSGHTLRDLARLGLPLHANRPNRTSSEGPHEQTPHSSDPGGQQAILDSNLPQGSENLLNTQESVFYSFYARLYETIGPLWQSLIRRTPYQHSIREGEYTTVVDVVFDREGNLKAVRELRSSGIPEFDQAVQDAWNRVKRFPNPPKGLLDSQDEVHTGWTFTVMVNPGFHMNYLPPERNY